MNPDEIDGKVFVPHPVRALFVGVAIFILPLLIALVIGLLVNIDGPRCNFRDGC